MMLLELNSRETGVFVCGVLNWLFGRVEERLTLCVLTWCRGGDVWPDELYTA
jgi:hypothetical protein